MFRLDRLTKEATSPPGVLPPPVLRHIMHAMIDAEDFARRHLHLSQDYLTALMADLTEPGLLQLWIAACSALAENFGPREANSIHFPRFFTAERKSSRFATPDSETTSA